MRTLLFTVAAAASAMALASPAAAQYYPQPHPQGYGYQNNYHDNRGHVRSLQVRLDQIQRRIQRLDNRDRINEREARRLFNQSREIERRLHVAARYGLHQREAWAINNQIQRLEQRLFRDVRDGRNWDRRDRDDDDRRGRGRGRDRD